MSAGKATRVGVLVIDPDVQSHLFPFVYGMAEKGIPFVGHIFGDQSRAGMDEGPSATGVFKFFQHAVYLGFRDFPVPHHKGGCTVLGRRVGELCFQCCEVVCRFNLVVLATGRTERQQASCYGKHKVSDNVLCIHGDNSKKRPSLQK